MTSSTQTTGSVRPFRCLVIQLARMGDTLQSLMALRAAKQLYPQLEIHFLARERFSTAVKKVPWIKEVITLPTDQLLSPAIRGEKNETQSLADLARWLGPIIKDPWDLIINWSFSEASSYLTALIPARIKLGYTRREDLSFVAADGWSHYVQAIIQGAIGQNIHLTDILTTQLLTALQIHIGDPLAEGNAPVTSKGFFSLTLGESEVQSISLNPSKKWISVQLGSSQKHKIWSASHWATLIQYFIKKNPDYAVCLLGGTEDINHAQSIMNEVTSNSRNTSTLLNLTGKTNFDMWASVISRSQWLISGDTAAIHLASVLGTRILDLSIGPVRHNETGPYGNGHYVMSSALNCEACQEETSQKEHICGTSLLPEAVYGVWSYGQNEWAHRRQMSVEEHFQCLGWQNFLSDVNIYRSRIRSTQDGGGVVFDLMTTKALQLNEWTARVTGHIARMWYCGWTPSIGNELTRETITPSLIQKLRELQESSEVLSKICEQASRTAMNLNQKSSNLKSEKIMEIKERNEIQDLAKILHDLEGLMDQISKTHSPLMTFSQMSKVLMHNLRGSQLSELGKETSDCYKQIIDGIEMFKKWIKFTLDLAKPMALKSSKVVSIGVMNKPSEEGLSP